MSTVNEFLHIYESWYQSAEGAFVLDCALSLTKTQLSPWSRRGKSLLLMGFSHWKVLELFWESGLDITVYAATPVHVNMAQTHIMHTYMTQQSFHNAIDTYSGTFAHLPFDDDSFDYVALMPPPRLEAYPPVPLMLQEALRVAKTGLLLQCWNPFSLLGLRRKFTNLPPFLHHSFWCPWRDVQMILQNIAPNARTRTASILHGPFFSWKHSQKKASLHSLNARPMRNCLGALMLVRHTRITEPPLTGLPLSFLQSHHKHLQLECN